MSSSSKKSTILMVDDEPSNLQVLGSTLMQNREYRVTYALNSEEALRQIEKNLPDLIILDIMMPGTDGFQLCAQLKQDSNYQSIPIIFLSADTDSDSIVKGFQLGAADYITKPFHPKILMARVQTQLKLKHAQDELLQLSMYDELTNLYNRRQFNQKVEEEWFRCMRHQEGITILLIDIDYFKRYNDCYGHLKGDHCIAQIADQIHTSFTRATDFVARYGGEEFVVLISQASLEEGIKAATRLLENIRSLELPHQASTVSDMVTISIGVASMVPTAESTPAQLIQEADNELYKAKEGGRNRISPQQP